VGWEKMQGKSFILGSKLLPPLFLHTGLSGHAGESDSARTSSGPSAAMILADCPDTHSPNAHSI